MGLLELEIDLNGHRLPPPALSPQRDLLLLVHIPVWLGPRVSNIWYFDGSFLLSFLILVEKYCYQNERAFRRWSCGQFLRDFNLLMISWSFLNDTIIDRDKNVWMNEMKDWIFDYSIPDKPLRSSDAQSFAPDFNCLRMRANFDLLVSDPSSTSMRENLFFSKILTKSESVRFGTVSSPRPLKQFNW